MDYDSDGLTSVAFVGCFRWVFTCSLLVCLWGRLFASLLLFECL